MKNHMARNVILMLILDLALGIVLSLYIASTGTVPAADSAAVAVAASGSSPVATQE